MILFYYKPLNYVGWICLYLQTFLGVKMVEIMSKKSHAMPGIDQIVIVFNGNLNVKPETSRRRRVNHSNLNVKPETNQPS